MASGTPDAPDPTGDRDASEAPGLRERLRTAPLEVLGRVVDASNAVLLARLDDGREPAEHAVYKPVAGERPLWDFPDGCLAHREVAAFLVADAGGWAGIPPTVLRTGPAGPGSVQRWVAPVPVEDDPFAALDDDTDDDLADDADDVDDGLDDADDADLADEIEGLVSEEADPAYVQLFAPLRLPAGWRAVLRGELADGSEVVLAHRDAPELRSLAVLDAVLNNSDRKGSHLLVGVDGRLWGIDHGLTFHAEDKMRTVLWGWAGEPLPAADVARLERLRGALAEPPAESDADVAAWVADPTALPASLPAALDRLLTVDEVDALRARIERLLRSGVHPHPSGDWPAVPWPAL